MNSAIISASAVNRRWCRTFPANKKAIELNTRHSSKAARIAISAASYRGAKCPTAEKQPKRAPSGSRQDNRKTAEKTAETAEKRLFWLFFGCFGCFSGCFSAVLPWPTRHPFRLFFGCFQCRAFGTSVAGRRDCKARTATALSSFLNRSAFGVREPWAKGTTSSTLPMSITCLVRRFTQRMDLRERSGITCVNLHFRSVGVTCVNLCSLPQDLLA